MARRIGSVSLFADSIDFLEDTSVNLLVLMALGWSARWRARLGTGLAALLLVPAVATAWTIWSKVGHPIAPSAPVLVIVASGALLINVGCALLLARFRSHGSLTRAAFLSARNDALANVLMIGAGAATAATASFIPDLVVGIGIAAMNADAAREVFTAARRERFLA